MEEVLDEAFDWLGKDIVLAHAKNPATVRDPEETISIQEYLEISRRRLPDLVQRVLSDEALWPQSLAASLAGRITRSFVDLQEFYAAYIERLVAVGFGGALIMHGMAEDQIEPSQGLITTLLARLDHDA